MISVEEARALVAQKISPLASQQVSQLQEAHGRVLAEDAISEDHHPATDRSMMDGYAFAAADTSTRFRVVGEVPAGCVPEIEVKPGECVRIFTGATLPKGTDAVIPQEDTTLDGDAMVPVNRGPKRWVRLRGSEGRPGQVVVPAGTRLGGMEISALAQAGACRPRVTPPLRVRHLATGDELVDAMETPPPGKIRDTNSLLLAGLLRPFEVEFRSSRCGDVLADLVAAISSSDGWGDLVLISGGASVGEYDFGARALREAGFQIHFDRLNLRPGKPLTFATRGAQVAFIIPGNPVSHFVCFETVVRHAVECLLGAPCAWTFVEMTHAGREALPTDARETFWPARVTVRDGRLAAVPQRWSSSGDTFSLVNVNGLIRVPCAGAAIAPGDSVRALLLDVPRGE